MGVGWFVGLTGIRVVWSTTFRDPVDFRIGETRKLADQYPALVIGKSTSRSSVIGKQKNPHQIAPVRVGLDGAQGLEAHHQ